MNKQELIHALLFCIGNIENPPENIYKFLSHRTRSTELPDIRFLFRECTKFSRKTQYIEFILSIEPYKRAKITRHYQDIIPCLDEDFVLLEIPCTIEPIGYRSISPVGECLTQYSESSALYAIKDVLNSYLRIKGQNALDIKKYDEKLIFS